MSQPLRIIFAGTPEFAAAHLQALLDSRHQVIAVYTQPDRPAGRGRKLCPSPVKQLAQQHDLPVYQPKSLKGEAEQQELAALDADLMVVVAYGLLLPKAVLDAPRLGCINVHGSILPRWRGAAPIQRAIEAGDGESGVTIMQMDIGLDTGAMLLKATCPINADDRASDLHDRLIEVGCPALREAVEQLAAGTLQGEAQDEAKATYAHKMSKDEAALDWSEPAIRLANKIRAFNPWPVCFCSLDGERMRIWQAQPASGQGTAGEILAADKQGIVVACGEGALQLTQVQLPGGKPLNASQLLNSRRERFAPGQRLD